MHNNKIEAIGLSFLLLAFGWQIFEQDLSSLSKETDKYQIHEKLDSIWMLLTDHYYEVRSDSLDPLVKTNVKSEIENWKYWKDILKEKERVESQESTVSYIRITIYIIGSILLIIPKFISDEKKKLTHLSEE